MTTVTSLDHLCNLIANEREIYVKDDNGSFIRQDVAKIKNALFCEVTNKVASRDYYYEALTD